MDTIAELWNKVKNSSGLERSLIVYDKTNHLLLLGNWSTFATPLAAISIKLESSQNVDLNKTDKFIGFELSYEKRVYGDSEPLESHFAILKCNDEKFNSYFLKFAEKLTEELENSNNSFIALKNFLDTWTEFFKKKKSSLLTLEEIVGLYGELVLLKKLIEKIGPTSEVVNFWRGPHEEAWDFEIFYKDVNYQIEVKTSHGEKVKINSLKQLNSDIPIVSYLMLQKVNYQKTAGINEHNTVLNLMHEIVNILTDNKAERLFLEKLELLGDFFENEKQIENCQKVVFQLRNQQWYLLTETFPILSDKSIDQNVFRKISEVKYSLNLESIPFLNSIELVN